MCRLAQAQQLHAWLTLEKRSSVLGLSSFVGLLDLLYSTYFFKKKI